MNAVLARRETARLAAQVADDARDKPHVCFVAPQCWPVLAGDRRNAVVGGAEVQQCIIARGLARAGYRVSMISMDYGQDEYERIDGIAMHKTHRPDEGLPVLRFLHPRLTSWWRTMRVVDADIYYQRSSAYLTAVVAEFARRHGKQSIYAAASDVDFRPGEEPVRYARDRWLFHRGLKRVDRLVVQNLGQQRDCLQNYHRDAVCIPSGYELPAASPLASPGAIPVGDAVLWVAVMREGKRPALFLDIAERLPHRRFVLVGGPAHDDPDEQRLYEAVQRRAAKLPNVTLTGFLPLQEAEPFFDQARVVVNTSVFEGMPNVFLQSWARGVPTIAFIDVGARLDDLPLYAPARSAEEAASAIERHFTDRDHWLRASRRARDYFEGKHSVRHVVECYARLFATLSPPAGRRA